MKKYFLILFLGLSGSTYAQEKSTFTALSLGLSPSLNKPIVPNYLTGSLGVGLAFYSDYKFREDLAISAKFGNSLLSYQNLDSNFKVSINTIDLELGLKKYFRSLDNSAFVLRAIPRYVFASKQDFTGIGAFTAPTADLTKTNKNQLTVSMYAGFEFNFKERSALELGYVHSLNQQQGNGYIDAVPHHIKMTYNINFLYRKRNNYSSLAKETLDKLQTDTLYFINRACLSDYTLDQLDSILQVNYTYSAYRIISDADIAAVSLQPNVLHFAVIGRYYASTGDPSTNGIYLLDKDLQLTEKPYPYYTSYRRSMGVKGDCFGGPGAIGSLVDVFNRRLSR